MLILGGSGSGKTNSFFNLRNHQPDIDKIYLYAKDPYEPKYQFLVNNRESEDLKHLNNTKAFIEYSNDMDDIYKNIENYNPNKKRKILTVLIIWFLICLVIKNLNPIVTELFIRARKLNILLVFIIQSYFVVPEDIRLNFTSCFIIKIPNKRELKTIGFQNSSDIDFHDFINPCKKCTEKPYSFLVIDNTLASDNPSRFRKDLIERI